VKCSADSGPDRPMDIANSTAAAPVPAAPQPAEIANSPNRASNHTDHEKQFTAKAKSTKNTRRILQKKRKPLSPSISLRSLPPSPSLPLSLSLSSSSLSHSLLLAKLTVELSFESTLRRQRWQRRGPQPHAGTKTTIEIWTSQESPANTSNGTPRETGTVACKAFAHPRRERHNRTNKQSSRAQSPDIGR